MMLEYNAQRIKKVDVIVLYVINFDHRSTKEAETDAELHAYLCISGQGTNSDGWTQQLFRTNDKRTPLANSSRIMAAQ